MSYCTLLFSREVTVKHFQHSSLWQDDEVVLQCVATIQKEHRKFCLAAEGLGNRLCYLELTSEAKVSLTHSSVQISKRRRLHIL